MRLMWMIAAVSALVAAPANARVYEWWHPDLRPPVVVGENSGPVHLQVGQLLEVRLPVQSGTGYSWAPASPLPPFLEFVGTHTLQPYMSVGLPGASQTQVFLYRPVASGEALVRLSYRRVWEAGVPPARMVEIPVTAGPWLY